MTDFEIELTLRGPLHPTEQKREWDPAFERSEIMRLKITIPREHAFEVAAVALEHGEEHGRFLGEMVDDPRFE